MTHDLYTDVPKLLISSNSIRLLNVIGQGNLNWCFGLYCILGLISALAKAGGCDKEQNQYNWNMSICSMTKFRQMVCFEQIFHFAYKHILCV